MYYKRKHNPVVKRENVKKTNKTPKNQKGAHLNYLI